MNVIYLLLNSSKNIVAIAIITGLVSGASSARLIALINSAVSGDITGKNILVWSFIGLALVTVISRFISELLLINLSQKVIFETRLLLCRRILASPLSYLEKLGTSPLLATLTEDVQAVADAVAFIPSLCIAIAVLIGCLAYLAWLSVVVFFGFVTFLVIAILIYELVTNKAKKYLQLARNEQDQLFNHFRAITNGIKELKLNQARRTAFIATELTPTITQYRNYNITGMTAFTMGLSWSQLLLFMVIGLVDFGLPRIMDISPTILSGYALTIIFIIVPLDAITTILPRLNKASIALQKIESLSLGLASRSEPENPQTKTINFPNLQLQGVTHTYKGEKDESTFTLGPIDITFYPQEIIFLVGGNGSGKSTLAKLIAGLYIPETGKIMVDSQIINDENREAYRQQFAAVFADFYLFNQLLGVDDPNLDNLIQDYLAQLQLEQKVKIEDGVFSTTSLSQGQRKRLALLTAYLEDRPFYIFDEWAADQDPVFKEIFYTELLPKLKAKGKTVLVISHDDRYFDLGDRILKLDYGKLV